MNLLVPTGHPDPAVRRRRPLYGRSAHVRGWRDWGGAGHRPARAIASVSHAFVRAFLLGLVILVVTLIVFAAFGPLFMYGWD